MAMPESAAAAMSPNIYLPPSTTEIFSGVRKKENWEGGRNPCQATPISKHPTLKSALARDDRV
jgi:hypothetical protein